MAELTPAQLDDLADRIAERLAARLPQLNAAKPKPPEAALSMHELAGDLGVCVETIRRWTAVGKIPVMRGVGPRGRKLYDRAAVRAALAKQAESPLT